MTDSIFYIRGPFPFGIEPAATRGMIRDASILLEADTSKLEAAFEQVRNANGFVDREKLDSMLKHQLSAEHAEVISRFVIRVRGRLRVSNETVEQLTKKIGEWLDENESEAGELLSKDQLPELERRMSIALEPLPCVERQAKAERLSRLTGAPLEDLVLVSDVRPVFNEDHEEVEGMMPYTILRVVTKAADGLPNAVEVILTEEDVENLANAAERAKKKLRKLHQLFGEKEIEVPGKSLAQTEDSNAD